MKGRQQIKRVPKSFLTFNPVYFTEMSTQTVRETKRCQPELKKKSLKRRPTGNSRIRELELRIKTVEQEISFSKFKYKNLKFNIEHYKDNPSNIAFYTGFTDFETLMPCYEIIENSVKNISYVKGTHRHAAEKLT